MVALVTLAQIKTDLRVEGNDDDVDLTLKLAAATEIVIDYIKRPDHGWTEPTAPFLIKAAIILVVRNLFDVENSNPITDGVKSILHRYRDPALA